MQRYNLNIRILLLLAFVAIASLGQSQVLQWSNPTKLRGTAIFTKVVGENEHGVFMMRYRNRFYTKNVILEKYDHHLSYQLGKSIELKNARLIKVKLMKNGVLIIKSSFGRKNETNQLYAQLYSFDFKPISREVLLVETPVRTYGDRGNYRVRISDNQEHVAVVFSNQDEQKKHQLISKPLYCPTLL